MAKEHYSKKGMYLAYDKNHKERDKLDYYSTPTEEVENILDTLNIDFNNKLILEPCAGQGHMLRGIVDYAVGKEMTTDFIATDVAERPIIFNDLVIRQGLEFDFLADDYDKTLPSNKEVDWIIMNPPFGIIEPFTIRALEIAQEGVIMLGRMQFLEGQGRYENIFKDNPPTYVYTYVDRIHCFKNGDTSVKSSSVQAYSWFVWDKRVATGETIHRWIRRADKCGDK